jgi:hypothetical protein
LGVTADLIDDIDAMKALLSDAATYGGLDGNLNEQQYSELRAKLRGVSRIQTFLPSFLRSRPTLTAVRLLSQEKGGYANRREFILESFAPALEFLYEELQNLIDVPGSKALSKLDSPQVRAACEKAISRLRDDPDGAITSARSLLETVCKYILDNRGERYARTADLPDLYKATIRAINLAPDQQSEDAMRQMLQGCLSVVQGIGTLRNRVGDAHGKDATAGVVEHHHASLGVEVACSVAAFLIVSWERRTV